MSQSPNTRVRVEMQVHGEWREGIRMQPRRFASEDLARQFVAANLRWHVARLEMDDAAMRAANLRMMALDPLLDPELREKALAAGGALPYPASELAALDAAINDPRDPWNEYLDHISQRDGRGA